jgi:4-diphosphocytidyl-2-C-methyl-D-erythritol kinase
MVVTSSAKVNLSLDVLGRREDGYHVLRTILQSVGLFDTLRFTPTSSGIVLHCRPPELESRSNLCWRAAELLQEAKGIASGVSIELEKTIPLGAGLGGGSGNAAATLLALNRLWGLNLTDEKLRDLAKRLGADVPFFLRGGCALAEGIGDELTPLPNALDAWLVLVQPDFPLATQEVYGWWDAAPVAAAPSTDAMRTALRSGDVKRIGQNLRNMIEPVVASRCPEIGIIKAQLLQSGAAGAAMTGTGSVVFGIFADESQAQAAAQLVQTEQTRAFVSPATRESVVFAETPPV